MEHIINSTNQDPQKDGIEEIELQPPTLSETGVKQDLKKKEQPTEKKLESPQGPGGRVVRGPFGTY
ncbi:MAG: hypothetical protein ABSE04_00535 [Candidatus Microgenomates bacterium]|jgi:hypothetical protein